MGRVVLLLGLTLALGMPVVIPVIQSLTTPTASLGDTSRLFSLASTSGFLALGAALVAVPAGVVTAVILNRVPMGGRGVLRGALLVALFVPLPVYAVAWQVVLGTWLPPLTLEPGEIAWRPWNQGLLPAVWVHGLAAWPWVVWITTASLHFSDRSLEEDALLIGGPGMVLRRVLFPRVSLAAIASLGWVVAQTLTEIPITDAMMVRTFAEEVYTQFVIDGRAGAVAVAIPVWVLALGLGIGLGLFVRRAFMAQSQDTRASLDWQLPVTLRVGLSMGLWLLVGAAIGLPLLALLWKAGGGGTSSGWALPSFVTKFQQVTRSDGPLLVASLGSALVAGVLATSLAWVATWMATRSRLVARVLFVLCVVLLVTPGPMIGIGLKATITALVDLEVWLGRELRVDLDFPPLQSALENQPSPLPAIWAAVARWFPVAVLVLRPVLGLIPRDLIESVRLDGFGPWSEWRLVVVPLTGMAALRSVLAVTALTLGEISASKLVNPPGRTAYVLRLFDQMHYGAESTVATLALGQILLTTLVAVLVLCWPGAGFWKSHAIARTG